MRCGVRQWGEMRHTASCSHAMQPDVEGGCGGAEKVARKYHPQTSPTVTPHARTSTLQPPLRCVMTTCHEI